MVIDPGANSQCPVERFSSDKWVKIMKICWKMLECFTD